MWRTAWIEIDATALAGNVAVIRRLAGPGVAILPVVKADAYGHGMLPIARTLEAAGAEGLSVATLDEAVALRDGGIAVPILVLYPIPPTAVADAARRSIGVVAGEAAGAWRRRPGPARRTGSRWISRSRQGWVAAGHHSMPSSISRTGSGRPVPA